MFVLSQRVPGNSAPESHLIAGVAQVGFGRPRADDRMLRLGYVVGRPSTRAELAVPVVSNGQVLGALNLESDRLGAFGPEDAEFVEFFASAAALSIEKSLLHRQVLEKQRIEHQLAVAHEVQKGLLPAGPPRLQGYDLAAVQLPTWTIGGDYFDFIPLPDGQLGLVVADVSGKGIPAALIMATFRAALRSELRRRPARPALMQALNRLLLEPREEARFVTAVFGSLQPGSGRLGYVNCGHNPPLLLRADGRAERLDCGGMALGMLPDAGFVSGSVHLRPGDTLALYTDGVVEPTGAGDEEFGVGRLHDVLKGRGAGRSAAETVLAVVEATRAFTGRDRYDDDFTLVVVKRD